MLRFQQKHANFIVNLGDASSSDVEQVITDVKDTVLSKYKYNLDLEVKIVGIDGKSLK